MHRYANQSQVFTNNFSKKISLESFFLSRGDPRVFFPVLLRINTQATVRSRRRIGRHKVYTQTTQEVLHSTHAPPVLNHHPFKKIAFFIVRELMLLKK